ncbi:hypothetical protein GWK47_043252 [Chionoecetes opilio]|uniref:Uncharacterized protein n=1 Tax=Chionoecetes opilio TaxID=41210 RepID=A0A8J5CZP0_CHIOP|nr:hypothetical protein GWK47_043252 [Chionoecetes opilio]
MQVNSCSPRTNIAFLKTTSVASSAVQVKKVMPQDTVFFTIVREPKAVFPVIVYFGQFQTSTGLTIDQYVTQMAVNATRIRSQGYLGYNQMTWDFGIPREDLNSLTAVANW